MVRLGVTHETEPNLPGSCRAPSLRTRSTAGFSCCLAVWRTFSDSFAAHPERIPRCPMNGRRAAIPAPSDASPCVGVSIYRSGEKEEETDWEEGFGRAGKAASWPHCAFSRVIRTKFLPINSLKKTKTRLVSNRQNPFIVFADGFYLPLQLRELFLTPFRCNPPRLDS